MEQYSKGEAISVSIFFKVHSLTTQVASNDEFASGAVYILSGKSQIEVFLSEFIRNSGTDGAMHIVGSNYSATVQESTFTENFATVSGGALGSTSLNVGIVL